MYSICRYGCAKKQSGRLQSDPKLHGTLEKRRLSFFAAACPPPHFNTDGAALPPFSSTNFPLIPFSVNSTSLAGTVMFCSTHRGHRSSSFFVFFCDMQPSHINTGTPHMLHFFFPT